MTVQKHNCGGELKPVDLRIRRSVGDLNFFFRVDGFQCSKCGEKVISRDAAISVEQAVSVLKQHISGIAITSETPQIAWRTGSDTNLVQSTTAGSYDFSLTSSLSSFITGADLSAGDSQAVC